MSSNRSERICPAAGRVPAGRPSARCVVMLGSTGRAPLAEIVDHISDACGSRTHVRGVSCRSDEARTEHAALGRLLDGPGAEPLPAHRVRDAALARVQGLLAQAPLVLTVTDAQWCDDGTLRCIDHLMRGSAEEPLTVLLSLSRGALAAAAAAFHELVARDYCAVADVDALWPGDTGRPAGPDPEGLGRHEPHLVRVARAAALLRSTDADLVGALAELPPAVADRALTAARAAGLLPELIPAQGAVPRLAALLGALPDPEDELLRAQAAEILNDAARPAEQVADLLLGLSRLDRPWMAALLTEAAAAARRDRPAAAVRYLDRLHRADPGNTAVRAELARTLLDIDPAAAGAHLHDGGTAAADGVPDNVGGQRTAALRLIEVMRHRAPDTPEALGKLAHDLWAGPRETDPASPGQLRRPTPVALHGLADRTAVEHVTLAARALRTALTGTDPRGAAAVAREVLRAERPRPAWARVAAAQVLGLADDTATALDHLDRAVADSARRAETWAEYHARSARALLLLESGRALDAAEAAEAAVDAAGRQRWADDACLAPIALALASVARADLDRAEEALRRLDGRRPADSVWAHHHHLMARALLERGRGRPVRALELMERCGASLAAAGVGNPVFTTWWVHSTDLLMGLGRAGAAAERAESGHDLAERWPTARSTGLSLLARGIAARSDERLELLAESVRVLAGSSDRHAHAMAELRLGRALLRRSDRKAARGHLHAARATAVRCGLTALAEQARVALAAAGGRPARVALSSAERRVAERAAAGATNRAIADALYLSMRTVEYHLTNVYRKLGVTGRAELAQWLPAQGPHTTPRVPGADR